MKRSSFCSLSLSALLYYQSLPAISRFYHIGNSLTGDLYYVFRLVGSRYETSQGNNYMWGYHFRGATTLPFFYNHPYEKLMSSHTGLTANSQYGTGNDAPWPEILPKCHWDVVTMEPFGFVSDQGPNNLTRQHSRGQRYDCMQPERTQAMLQPAFIFIVGGRLFLLPIPICTAQLIQLPQ